MAENKKNFDEEDNVYEFEETMVTLKDEDGIEKDFYIDDIFDFENKIYAAAIPADSDQQEITEYFLFRLKELGDDDFEMEDITDENEYDAAADAYEERLDTRDWNDTFDGEE